MHEMSLCESIMRIIGEQLRQNGFARVKTVRLEVGTLACVEPEALRFGFAAVSRGTPAQGSALDIIAVPGEGWCADCATAQALTRHGSACAQCGGPLLYRGGGDALRVMELEVE